MRFVIHGASLETGTECKVIVEAATPIGAIEQAQAMRVAVSSVEIEQPAVPVTVTGTVLTERTAKPIKKHIQTGLIGILASIAGGVLLPAFLPTEMRGPTVLICGLLFWASVIYYLIAKYRAWWHHG